MTKDFNRFLQRRHTNGQQVNKKMIITNYQGNANQNHDGLYLIPTSMAIKKKKTISIGEDVKK